MPDNLSNTAFGYIGIVLCDSCYHPNHVFVDSSRKREMCLDCHGLYTYPEGDGVLGFPNADTFPVLNEEVDTCKVCERPTLDSSMNWKPVEAFLSDGTTLITAHNGCTRRCCDMCEARYAVSINRNYRRDYQIHRSQFTTVQRIEGDNYCDPCSKKFWLDNPQDDYFECDNCNSYAHYDNSGFWRSSRYCQSCIENNVYDCRDCGISCWDGDDHDCPEDDDNDDSLIHSYSYRPSPFFFGEGKYHFGFELEVEARGNGRYEGAQIVENMLGGHAYLKEDGSISDGFEIVTHPHTLDVYHNDFNWSVLDSLKNQGYRSWNTRTCGIHVHVSRTAFGNGDPWDYRIKNSERSLYILQRQAHELRFMKLIYDNQRQVERIAGRSNNSYATFADKGHLVRKIKHGVQNNGRYSAINTENDATIEVRVFKGSLRKERVLSAIEFVHASVEYTRDMKVTSKNHALSWLKFTGYVSANAEMYPNLVTIMSESFAGDDNPIENDN